MNSKQVKRPQTCIVVSYWSGHPKQNLSKLFNSMEKHAAGADYDLKVVCNGGDEAPLRAADVPNGTKIINRPNTGYNLGAWDAGWRDDTGYENYLFLQDECTARRPGWLEAYVYRMSFDAHIGLLGESMNWNRLGWDFIEEDTRRSLGSGYIPISHFHETLAAHGVPAGPEGSHLQSLIWFARGKALQDVGQIYHSDDYNTAVACEVMFSRAMAAKGWGLAQVKNDKFHFIMHPQWAGAGRVKRDLRNKLSKLKRKLLH